jgi:hypothetical protein
MHTRHALKIADRIHRVLLRELGQDLDRQRMVREPLYARDVLLVCDALRDTDAPFLAQHFRRAASAPEEGEGGASAREERKGGASAREERKGGASARARGFSVSRFLVSLFGAEAQAPGR